MKKYLNLEDFKEFVSDFFDKEKSKAFVDFKVDKLISTLLTEKIYDDTKESFINNIDKKFIEEYFLPFNKYISDYKKIFDSMSEFSYLFKNDTHTVSVSKKIEDTTHLIKFPSFLSKAVNSYSSSDIEYRSVIEKADSTSILKTRKSLYQERNQQHIGYDLFSFNNDFDELRQKILLEHKSNEKIKNTIDFLNKYISEAFNSYGKYCVKESINKDFLDIYNFISNIESEINNIKKNHSYKEIFEFMEEKKFDFKNLNEEHLDILKLSFDYNIDRSKFIFNDKNKNNRNQTFKV